MASETTTAAISQQHFQSNSNQPIRILPLHRGCTEVRYIADSLNTLNRWQEASQNLKERRDTLRYDAI